MTDEDIRAQIAEDPEVAPELDAEWFRRARVVVPDRKVPISLRVDPGVLAWFRAQGAGYQSQMNAVLRAYVEYHAESVRDARRSTGRER